ncbi:MAG: hypothetical protein A2233_02335 [Candidatus Kerfeldbacteria bacterium RIFOXYA2_FULL_38_24]|uniref:Nucleoid-associated protein, YbaB/EbfC family n=1 Tax=Candidatus Kerfeldbacteria bacterium RIFOXYB2_FULL_38_14 TaxID=1798547 RepID=A0A1G2BGU7_9BACT|nr:MAG: hypothetical protein A2319_04935 [Candidatus Kerfeldbacteria bacterium RIFOXYB2_FULL_38_14]OGY87949.1 MAG: hypothetical protein A2233_02335 [Candidatus Kerfeldbacteria bacterium RIFOXYA2_FULL_38_24]OGY88639.1 MAG: hypothetical protein A2458_03265 [Candidatus Kerfeldbacteria bacterium RIFOXYC2_FULL_38_9]
MFQKLKQYKDLRNTAKKAQSVLEEVTVHADTEGGKIAVVMDGNQKILSLNIDSALLAPENKEKIEKGIKEVIADAMKKLQRQMMMKMKAGELEMPDMSKLS